MALTNAVTFGVYGIMSRNYGNMSNMEIARNGVVSGTVRAFVISPIEVVKIQQQVNPARSLVQVASEVWRTAGLRGFARGFTTTLTREPVAFGCYFSSFEILSRGRKESNSWLFVAGGLAGICSWVTTYPQVPTASLSPTLIRTPEDVIKSRVQGDGWGPHQRYSGTLHCLRQTIGEAGWSVLYRGFGSTTYRAFIVNGVILMVYNNIMTHFS